MAKGGGGEGEVRMRLLLCQGKLVIYKTDKKKKDFQPSPPTPHHINSSEMPE